MIQLQKLFKHPFDTSDRLTKSHQMGLWNCIQCQQCTETCPQDIDPAKSIRELRLEAFKVMGGLKKAQI
jgi:succinate dehydrogenase/fumarate reductase-like Fe-S protein